MSRRDAEHLLDRTPSGVASGGSSATAVAHAGLVTLLAAASAPPLPAELAGEEDAVAAFGRAYEVRPVSPAAVGPAEVRPAAVPSGRGRVAAVPPRSRRGRVAVVALSVVAALVGGTAYAAGTSRLPDPVQRRLHEALSGVGVPPPSPDSPPPSASPAASSGPAPLLLLCLAWQATRTTPGAPEIRPEDKRTLAAAAGGPARIADFCATLTATRSATPSAPASPGKPGNPDPGAPPTTPPGNGNGNGKTGAPADPGTGNGQNRKGKGPAG